MPSTKSISDAANDTARALKVTCEPLKNTSSKAAPTTGSPDRALCPYHNTAASVLLGGIGASLVGWMLRWKTL